MKRLRSSGTVSGIDPSGSVNVLQQISDMLRGVQADVSQIIIDYNKELFTTIGTLPQGKSETRWRLSTDDINPRVNNLDGANIFVDTSADASKNGGRFWLSNANTNRPKTVKESLLDIYTTLTSTVDQLRTELSAATQGTPVAAYNTSLTSGNLVEDDVRSLLFDGTTVTATSAGTGVIQVVSTASGGGGSGTDEDAIHDNVPWEIAAVPAKDTPTTSDYLLIEDAADSNNKKSITINDLPVATPASHASSHENGGGDEISVAGLSGLLADDQNPTAHTLGGSAHSADSLANINSKISDATLDDSSDPRDPNAHTLGGAAHSSDTLANINTKISDATLDDSGDSRPPSGAASGDLGGTYPSPTVNDGADSTAIHDNIGGEIAAITAKSSPVSTDLLLIEDSEYANEKKSITIADLPSSGIRGPSIVVGNAINGDTADDCDYLDTGNGAQLEAAIQAADDGGGPVDVWIRPGPYSLGIAGSPSGGITIPASVKVRGAGRSNTIIAAKTSGDLTAFYLSANSELSDLSIYVNQPTGNGTGGEGAVVFNGSNSECHRVNVQFLNYSFYDATDAAELNYKGAFFVAETVTRVRGVDCDAGSAFFQVPKLMPLTAGSEVLSGFYVDSNVASISADFDRCRVVGSDRAYAAERTTRFHNCEFESPYDKGFYITGTLAGASQITDCWGTLSASSGSEIGIHIVTAGRVDISGNYIYNGGGPFGTGISLASCDNSIVSGNRGEGWATSGITLDGTSDSNIVTSNHVGSVSDSGTSNDVAHNK